MANKKLDKVIDNKTEGWFKNLMDFFLFKKDKVDVVKWIAIMLICQTALLVFFMKLWKK
jgi:hypothetical protein